MATKKKRPQHSLQPVDLSALNRFVEHHGQTRAAKEIGVSVATIYAALQPGTNLAELTVDKIRDRINGTRAPQPNLSDGVISLAIELNLSDAMLLVIACAKHKCTPDEWLTKLAIGSLRAGIEY